MRSPASRYRYDLLPSGLIPQLIVEAHDLLTAHRTVWRSGGISRSISARSSSTATSPTVGSTSLSPVLSSERGALAVISAVSTRHSPAKLGSGRRRGGCRYPDQPENDVSYDFLEQLELRYGVDHRQLFEDSTTEYCVGELLAGVRHEQSDPQPSRSEQETRSSSLNVVAHEHANVTVSLAGQTRSRRGSAMRCPAPSIKVRDPRGRGPLWPR